jgi:hypothetical protein
MSAPLERTWAVASGSIAQPRKTASAVSVDRRVRVRVVRSTDWTRCPRREPAAATRSNSCRVSISWSSGDSTPATVAPRGALGRRDGSVRRALHGAATDQHRAGHRQGIGRHRQAPAEQRIRRVRPAARRVREDLQSRDDRRAAGTTSGVPVSGSEIARLDRPKMLSTRSAVTTEDGSVRR